ncbi:MAG: hypothetical protein E7442_04870 [Ruminococcaceae bacterium]|nr:hypothetical protein [Oscillospiraceae bacterium]
MFNGKQRMSVSAGGALGLAALLFLVDLRYLPALLTAALMHELGHMAALKLCRAELLELRLEFFGLCLVTTPPTSSAREAFCALCGPAAGLLWAVAIHRCHPLAAAFSLLLSAYNLLPALPLDGGRALLALCGRRWLLRLTGGSSAFFVLALALWAPLPMLLFPAFWLWLEAIRA